MALSPAQLARNRLAGAVTSRGPDSPEARAARADLAAENLASWIKRTLASAPPLSEAQVARLRALLPAPAGDGDAA